MANNRIFRVFVMQRKPPEDKNVVWFDSEEHLFKIYENGKWVIYSPNNALLISKQDLTDKQKEQVRKNLGIKIYSGDNEEIIQEEDGTKTIFKIGKIPVSKVTGLDEKLNGLTKGIIIRKGDVDSDVNIDENYKAIIKLGKQLSYNDNELNLIWYNFS